MRPFLPCLVRGGLRPIANSSGAFSSKVQIIQIMGLPAETYGYFIQLAYFFHSAYKLAGHKN
jgi:hypothetical protein